MDYPGSCRTNVLKIGGFSSISYLLYALCPRAISDESVDSNGRQPDTSPAARNVTTPTTKRCLDLFQKLEFRCRDKGLLVASEGQTLRLWVFEHADQQDVISRTLSGLLKDLHNDNDEPPLKPSSAVFSPADLDGKLSAAARTKAPASAPPTAATFEQGARALKSMNPKATQANRSYSASSIATTNLTMSPTVSDVSKEQVDSSTLYRLFMTAVISTISYSLAKSYGYLPVGFNTLVQPIASEAGRSLYPEASSPLFRDETTAVTTINAHLTSTGILLIKPAADVSPVLTRLGPDTARVVARGSDIVIAPSGRVARIADIEGTASPFVSEETDDSHGPHRSLVARWRDDLWKASVTDWLLEQGVDVFRTCCRLEWVRLQLKPANGQCTSEPEGTAITKELEETVLWPIPLCFIREGIPSGQRSGSDPATDAGLLCFVPAEKGGMWDPLMFSEQWYATTAEREEEILKARLDISKTEKSTARRDSIRGISVVSVHARSHPTSPTVLTRGGQPILIESQSANGVYPTPPDGFNPTAMGSSDATGATPRSAANTLIHNEGQTDPMDGLTGGMPQTPFEVDSPDQRRTILEEAKGSLKTELDHGGEPPLEREGKGENFGDMDEVMFDGNDITEDDFNFFDDPGGDDMLGQMRDGLTANGSVPALEDFAVEQEAFKPEDSWALSTSVKANDHENLTSPGAALMEEHADVKEGDVAKSEPQEKARTPTDEAINGAAIHQSPVAGNAQQALTPPTTAATPPLSPTHLKQRLLPSGGHTLPDLEKNSKAFDLQSTQPAQTSASSRFDHVAFNPALKSTKDKYSTTGRFGFTTGGLADHNDAREGASSGGGIPRVGLPGKRKTLSQAHVHSRQDSRIGDEVHAVEGISSMETANGQDSEADPTLTSDTDSISDTSGEPSTTFDTSLKKRKRSPEDDGDTMVSSLQRLAMSRESKAAESINAHNGQLTAMTPRPGGDCTTLLSQNSFGSNERLTELSDETYMEVAQILTDQVIGPTVGSILHAQTESPQMDEPRLHGRWARPGPDDIIAVVQERFPQTESCDFASLAAVEDGPPEPALATGRQLMRPKPQIKRALSGASGKSNGNEAAGSKFALSDPPHLLIRRGDTPMEILPPALRFWETFGFGPCSGVKDITAFCVHPAGQGIGEAAEGFLERLGSVYEACKLGKHVCGELYDFNKGLVPVHLDVPDPGGTLAERVSQAIQTTCTYLDHAQNVVIYLVDPYEVGASVAGLCAAWSALSRSFRQACLEVQPGVGRNIVLQIVPIGQMTPARSFGVPTPEDYTALALEVYERCCPVEPDQLESSPTTEFSPAMLLARTLPKRIDLKLTMDSSVSLDHERRCLHVGYSCSRDQRWISVGWSDAQGGLRTAVSFCTGRKGSTMRPFLEVAQEVWQITLDRIRWRPITWRVFIAKAGVMSPDEANVWTRLAAQATHPPVALSLLSVDMDFSLCLQEGDRSPMALDSPSPTVISETPVATPQPNVQSPEQSAATPSSGHGHAGGHTEPALEMDDNATITDMEDEVWAVVLSHRSHVHDSVVEHRPALASGYLVQRMGSGADEAPMALGVDLLHGSRPYEPLLREILAMYRGLGDLARIRGVTDGSKGVLPWHIAAAAKAQEALGQMM
ncbi:MAG: mediator of RNA polymerase II transcription subunit 13 [Caeruleum heppii]|nr:MAG: mediator of RNA polymerase II transcription subunit 13 [Caeruleum heppii]